MPKRTEVWQVPHVRIDDLSRLGGAATKAGRRPTHHRDCRLSGISGVSGIRHLRHSGHLVSGSVLLQRCPSTCLCDPPGLMPHELQSNSGFAVHGWAGRQGANTKGSVSTATRQSHKQQV